MTLIAKLWELLDEATDNFMGIPKDERTTPAALKAAGEARGLSKAIHVMCQPHYEDSTAVAKLAIKRMKQRKAGEEVPPAAGEMDEATSQAAVVTKHDETKAKPVPKKAAPKKAGPATASEVVDEPAEQAGGASDAVRKEAASLSEQQIKQIANGIRCGFEPDKLAELYSVSPAAIAHVAGINS